MASRSPSVASTSQNDPKLPFSGLVLMTACAACNANGRCPVAKGSECTTGGLSLARKIQVSYAKPMPSFHTAICGVMF